MKTEVTYHPYREDPELPGTCMCGRVDPRQTNRVHKLPDFRQQQDEHRRRAGEQDHE